MATGEADRIMWTALALGLLTATPILASWWIRRRRVDQRRRRAWFDATPRLF